MDRQVNVKLFQAEINPRGVKNGPNFAISNKARLYSLAFHIVLCAHHYKRNSWKPAS